MSPTFFPITCRGRLPNPNRFWFVCALMFGAMFGFTVAFAPAAPVTPDTETPSQDTPPREWVLADLADGKLDEHDLFTAAIILSGADSGREISAYQRRLEAFALLVRNQTRQERSSKNLTNRGLQILKLQHDRLLTGEYDAGCGDLRRAFDSGDFNCATATILYQAISRRCGLQPTTIALPGHVRCQLQGLPLETTRRAGRLDENEMHGASDDWSVDLPADERELTDVQLLAKLLYNQGLTHLASGRFADALATTELSWQLDREHVEARQNVAAVVNNWALQLSSPGTYDQAIALLSRGQEVAPDFGLLSMNERRVLLAWHAQALSDGETAKADRIRSLGESRHPDIRWRTAPSSR